MFKITKFSNSFWNDTNFIIFKGTIKIFFKKIYLYKYIYKLDFIFIFIFIN